MYSHGTASIEKLLLTASVDEMGLSKVAAHVAT